MRFATDLGARERGIYRASFDDGLLDLFSGLGLMLIGLAWLVDLVALGAVAPALLLPFWPLARRRITEPRTGFARFREERVALETRKQLGLVAVGCLFLAAAVASWFAARAAIRDNAAQLVAGLPAALLAIGAVLAGMLLGLARFGVYAIFLIGAGALVIRENLEPGWSILGGGAAILLCGLGLLARFVATHRAVSGDE